MLFLTATTETFTLVTTAALSTDWSVGYVDMDTTVGATAGSAQGNVSTATTTTIVAAPGANVQRQLKSFTVVNKDASSTQTVTLNKVTGAGTFALGAARTVALAAGESLTYIDSVGFASFDSVGRLKVTNFGGVGATSAVFARGDFTWSSTLVGPLTANSFIPSSSTVPSNGVYLPAANTVGISTNSTNAVKIDASQNIGVGGLNVDGLVSAHTSNRTIAAGTGQLGVYSTDSQAANLGGQLIFGGAYSGTTQTTFTSISGRKENSTSANTSGYLAFATNLSGTGMVERMRIDSSGNVGIGVTPTTRFHVHSAANPTLILTDAVLDSTYGGAVRGYGLGGFGGFLELGVLDAGTYTKGILIAQQATSIQFFAGTTERMRIDSGGQLVLQTVGKGISIKEGSNAKQGTVTLVAGTSTVSNTSVTASSRIFLTAQSLGTVTVPQALAVTARSANTSFTITSSTLTDTSVVAYEIFEPS